VGGMRISAYNACSPEWIDTLAAFMDEFAQQNA
jgi:phosphoserine aminotransferase